MIVTKEKLECCYVIIIDLKTSWYRGDYQGDPAS
jgi:hypothetical protein